MSSNTASIPQPGFTASAPDKSNIRWFVCALLFAATTINYMDRSVFSFIEPLLHNVAFMGWDFASDRFHQPAFDKALPLARRVVFGVFRQVAVGARLGDRADDRRPLDRFEPLYFLLQPGIPLGGHREPVHGMSLSPRMAKN